MSNFKWKKIPIFANRKAPIEQREILDYIKVNHLSNHQLSMYMNDDVYIKEYPQQVEQMKLIAKQRAA